MLGELVSAPYLSCSTAFPLSPYCPASSTEQSKAPDPVGPLVVLKANLSLPTVSSAAPSSPSGKKLSYIAAIHLPDPTKQLSTDFMLQPKEVRCARAFPPLVGGVIAFVTSVPTTHCKRAIILIYKQVGNLFSHALKNHCAIRAGCAD